MIQKNSMFLITTIGLMHAKKVIFKEIHSFKVIGTMPRTLELNTVSIQIKLSNIQRMMIPL
jgi:hypothetical protein